MTGRRTSSTASASGQEGANFGFPYCHANGIPDPDIRIPNACAGVVLPAALTGPHSAGLGIKFYTGTMFPQNYRNVAFIARHGSWNREKRFGYDVAVARTDGGKATIEPFMTGMLDDAANQHPQPAELRVPDGGRLAPGVRRAAWRDLSDHLQRTRGRSSGRLETRERQVGGGRWLSGWRLPRFTHGAAIAQADAASPSASSCAAPAMARTAIRGCRTSPSLAGQPEFYLTNQLFLFREGVRKSRACRNC